MKIIERLKRIFGRPTHKLKALSLEESKKKCNEINATEGEIQRAKDNLIDYICIKCGYHSGVIRRCPACNGWLRYNQLYEKILEERELKNES